jgi:hypothetical protein
MHVTAVMHEQATARRAARKVEPPENVWLRNLRKKLVDEP